MDGMIIVIQVLHFTLMIIIHRTTKNSLLSMYRGALLLTIKHCVYMQVCVTKINQLRSSDRKALLIYI